MMYVYLDMCKMLCSVRLSFPGKYFFFFLSMLIVIASFVILFLTIDYYKYYYKLLYDLQVK